MSLRQLVALFCYSLVIWSLGNGLLPLLPVIARQLNAGDPAIGIYLALAYLAVAAGTVAAGWITDAVGNRRLFLVVSAAAMAPLTAAVSRVTAFEQLVALTIAVWFFAGMGLSLTSILAGLSAAPAERGRVFGILTLTGALGAVIGGFTVGPLANRLGYLPMFIVLALPWLLCAAVGLFVEDRAVDRARLVKRRGLPRRASFPTAFLFLVASSVLAGVALFVGILGRSLVMDRLGFDAAAITSTVAVAGLVTLPVAPTVGILSDRLGRTGFLALCYAACAAGLVVFSSSASLWNFWIASSLIAFVSYGSTGVGSALVADLIPPQSLGRGMSVFGATTWIGAVLGFAGTGLAIHIIGAANTFFFGMGLAIGAVILLLPVRAAVRRGVSSHATAADS